MPMEGTMLMPSKYVRVGDGETITITVDPDNVKEAQGKFGPQYEYTLADGRIFTASKYLADQINAVLDVETTNTITISRTRKGNRTRYEVEPEAPVKARGRAAAAATTGRDFYRLAADFKVCMTQAVGVCESVFGEGGYTSEDVRSVAASLFIEANRSGTEIPQAELDLELEDIGDGEDWDDEDTPF